jgi:CHAT domain-containing protein/Flp pilus assembly protein TadD
MRLVLAACTLVSMLWPQTVAQVPAPAAELERATFLEDQAETFANTGKRDEALAAATQSLAIRERLLPADDPAVASSLHTLGFVHYGRGELGAAESAFSRALRIRRIAKDVDPGDLADTMNNLGAVYMAEGLLRDAEPLLTEALALQERLKAPPAALGGAYNSLGGLLRQRGDYLKARQQFARAAELWEQAYGPEDARVGRVLNNLGLVSQDLGDYAQAVSHYRKSVAIQEKAGDSTSLAAALQNLASAMQEQGGLDDATPLYRRAIAMYEKVGQGESAGAGQAMNNLAVLSLLRKDYASAGPLFQRALLIRQKALGPRHPDVATSLHAYAVFLNNTGRLEEAVETQARAVDIAEENVALSIETGSEAQKERYLQLFSDSLDVTLWMRSRAHNAAADRTALLTVLRRKGRIQDVLAASSEALREAGGNAASPDLGELSRARATMASLVLQARGDANARQRAVDALQERIDSLEAKISARSAELGRLRTVTIEGLQAAIPVDAVLIEFFQYRPFDPETTKVAERFGAPRYAVCAIRRTGAPEWLELGDAAPIDAQVASFRNALVNPAREDVRDRAASLRPSLTDLVTRLAGPTDRLLIVPDGDLNLLPFQALVGRDGRFLLERFHITYLTGGRELLARPSAQTPGPPVIVSNPDFGWPATVGTGVVSRRFEPLPGAEAEARAVAELFRDAQVLAGADASETRIKSLHHPSILHIATHGFFLSGTGPDAVAGSRGLRTVGPPPATIPPLLRSGLALAGANTARAEDPEDGILTASEAAMLDLGGTQMVFLSACESGLGVVNAGESVYGLRRAFAIAGAQSQVLTLWQVNDRATLDFVVDFYRRLKAGESRAGALRGAQLAALAAPATHHPFFWAAFILSGADGPLVRTLEK